MATQERVIIDLVRSIMYGSNEVENVDSGTGKENLYGPSIYEEAVDLAIRLAEYDGVPFMPEQNRLLLLLLAVKECSPGLLHKIEKLNNPKE